MFKWIQRIGMIIALVIAGVWISGLLHGATGAKSDILTVQRGHIWCPKCGKTEFESLALKKCLDRRDRGHQIKDGVLQGYYEVQLPQACSSGQTDKCDRPKGCVAHPRIRIEEADGFEIKDCIFIIEPNAPLRMSDTMHSIDKETGLPNEREALIYQRMDLN